MSQRDKYIESVSQTFQAALDTLISKSAQYATEEQPFKNYEGSAKLAGIDVQRWFIANMAEKLIRLENLLTVGLDNDTPDEPFVDSLVDLINQAAGLKAWRESKGWKTSAEYLQETMIGDLGSDPGDEHQDSSEKSPADKLKEFLGWK